MRDGKYFMDATDLTGPDGVDYETVTQKKHGGRFKIKPRNIKWSGRSIINKRERFLVERMMKEARFQACEHKNQLKKLGKANVNFFIAGSECIFDGGRDNCLTWSKKILKLADIVFKGFLMDKFVALASNYTHSPDEFVGVSNPFDYPKLV